MVLKKWNCFLNDFENGYAGDNNENDKNDNDNVDDDTDDSDNVDCNEDDDDDDGSNDNNLYFAMGSKCRAVCYY